MANQDKEARPSRITRQRIKAYMDQLTQAEASQGRGYLIADESVEALARQYETVFGRPDTSPVNEAGVRLVCETYKLGRSDEFNVLRNTMSLLI